MTHSTHSESARIVARIVALQEIRQLARDRGGYFDGLTLALIARICREALDD